MGMFDNVICKVELPDGLEHNKYVFQTKDLDCLLNARSAARRNSEKRRTS